MKYLFEIYKSNLEIFDLFGHEDPPFAYIIDNILPRITISSIFELLR